MYSNASSSTFLRNTAWTGALIPTNVPERGSIATNTFKPNATSQCENPMLASVALQVDTQVRYCPPTVVASGTFKCTGRQRWHFAAGNSARTLCIRRRMLHSCRVGVRSLNMSSEMALDVTHVRTWIRCTSREVVFRALGVTATRQRSRQIRRIFVQVHGFRD